MSGGSKDKRAFGGVQVQALVIHVQVPLNLLA